MLKQQLNQKLLQKLSPQQIQLMKLLQIPTATLEQRIKEELEANPALEEGEEVEDLDGSEMTEDDLYEDKFGSNDEAEEGHEEAHDDEPPAPEEDVELDEFVEEYLEDDIASYKLSVNNASPDEDDKTIPVAVESSLQEHLENQLGMLDLDERTTKIALQILGSIDDDGYLRRETISLVDDLAFAQNVMTDVEEIDALLAMIQRFDPPGIGARDLQECLSIQLHQKLDDPYYTENSDAMSDLKHAIALIDDYFNEFSKKHYAKLMRSLDLDDDMLKAAIDEVLKLNPKPASAYLTSTSLTTYIVPDFVIKNEEGELVLSLNARNAPELTINRSYQNMLSHYDMAHRGKGRRAPKKEREAMMFIKQKIDSARWFIDAIKQRQQTMYKTMYSIMQYQYDYFLSGDERQLRPMILKDIADITGLDISTVSRVANSKYVQTEFGTKRLKDFFSESLQTESGEEVSTIEVKNILTDLIGKENKRRPLSDEKLKNALQDKGYHIARRTVAKYREQLNIPVARLRKEL